VESLLPLASFAFVSSITPGPNNLMLSASGVAFGLKRTVPHMLGIVFGFAMLLLACGLGVGALLERFAFAGLGLKIIGSAYLIYLGWVMRDAFAPRDDGRASRPLTFVEAVLFQFVNPKGWIMGLTAVSVFLPAESPGWTDVLVVVAVFLLVGIPCIWAWAALGVGLRRTLAGPRGRRIAGVVLAMLMGYTVVAIWL
jgi:threonine/homoserine/homoserine lactone efflux protein